MIEDGGNPFENNPIKEYNIQQETEMASTDDSEIMEVVDSLDAEEE